MEEAVSAREVAEEEDARAVLEEVVVEEEATASGSGGHGEIWREFRQLEVQYAGREAREIFSQSVIVSLQKIPENEYQSDSQGADGEKDEGTGSDSRVIELY